MCVGSMFVGFVCVWYVGVCGCVCVCVGACVCSGCVFVCGICLCVCECAVCVGGLLLGVFVLCV